MVKKKHAAKKKQEKITARTTKLHGKAVAIKVNGEPIGEVGKITGRVGKKQVTRFISSNSRDPDPLETAKVHRSETKAIRHASRGFPQITPKFRKLL